MAINTVEGFNSTDKLDFSDLKYTDKATATLNTSTDILTVRSGGSSERVELPGTDVTSFETENDGSGGTEVVAACYAAGTMLRSASGVVPVDELAIGDLVVTAGGAYRAIRWLGHRTVDCRNHSRPHTVLPIQIAAHAFGDNRPARDLLVSPGHSICVDVLGEVLIPATSLVNGSSIRQVEVDEVTYWHIELDSHDVLLAENLPAESYLDMGNRGFFCEAAVVAFAAGPDVDPASRRLADVCRPFHDAGPLVDTVRARIASRAKAARRALTDSLDPRLQPTSGLSIRSCVA